MLLHLVVPGLYSRLPEWQRSYGWLPQAAGLQTLLSGAQQAVEADDALAVAAELLGAGGAAVGFRRRAHGLGDEAGWVCADPVHLRADVDSAVLVEAEHLALDEAEACALVSDLEALFADDGWRFEVADAAHWYARPPVALAPPDLPGVREAAGRDVGAYLRNSAQSAEWKRFYAELQMLLAQSEVNRRRESQGMTPVNALWFWGGSTRSAERPPRVRLVQGGDVVLRGMAQTAGLKPSAPALDTVLSAQDDALVCLDALRQATAYDDIEAWQEALAELDVDWFAPLAQALDDRRLDAVVLYADERRWDARRRRGLARWRRETPLSQSLALSVSP